MVVPTLAAGEPLDRCLNALRKQTWRDFETIVADNSGQRRVPDAAADRVFQHERNLGFGGAINHAAARTESEFVAIVNDDAEASPGWLEALIRAAQQHPRAGMFASQVRLDAARIDSAGMLLCGDGSSKQRGHGRPPSEFARVEEALLPSGSAAMYRRSALAETGLFDEEFFLYCEDTDLGLRLRWAGWGCVYVADAVVDHAYSATAGRASPLKAYLVERNRLRVAVKNFPLGMLAAGPIAGATRYFWHAVSALGGRGAAGEFAKNDGAAKLVWFAVKAHLALAPALPDLIRKRRAIPRRISAAEFAALARRFAISPREVASQ